MLNKNLNTTIEYEMIDGTKVSLTLTFYALYQLKNKKKNIYFRYNEIMKKMSKGSYDELEMVAILYTAYLCANLEEENVLSEEEFIMLFIGFHPSPKPELVSLC